MAMLALGLASQAHALNQATHKIINEEAAVRSTLNSILKSQLGIPQGVLERFNERSVTAWIGEGGIREDDGIRFSRHFHDPLEPWATAGLKFFGQFQSSIRWMQRPADCPDSTWRDGKDWTWSSGRCYFRRALTEANRNDRDLAWAYTFRAVGQLMHLVVDASVPEHTRNDPHPLGGLFGSYEYEVQKLHGRPGSALETAFIATYLATPVQPDATLVEQPTGDAEAPVPVARLIDAEVYTGVDPNVTLIPAIGIAEFANANFFSEDSGYRRFLAPNYPHPRVEALVPSSHPVPRGSGVRAYYKKGPGDGLGVDPVLAECALDAAFRDDGIATPRYKCADANVWEQTATAMLPRAVGYAAALVDYFFRGRLEGQLLPPEPGTSNARMRIRNPIPDDGSAGERMLGAFELLYDAADGTRVPIVRWEGQDLAPGTQRELVIPAPPAGASPPAEPGRYLLVFQGQLGDEPGAVAATWVDGRVWSLTFQMQAYDEDFTLTTPPGGPVTFRKGPTYTKQMDVSDSAHSWGPDGTDPSSAAAASVYSRGQLHLFTCQGADYAAALLGVTRYGDYHRYAAVYRGSGVPWARTAQVSLAGAGTGLDERTTPVTVEIVRFAPPKSLEDLQSYSYQNPPVVEAVLATFVAESTAPADVGPIELGDAVFVGVRVTPLPQYPEWVPDASRNGPLDYLCFRSLLRYGAVDFVGATGAWAHSSGQVDLRIPIAP
jgi:hypothetical protein